MDKEKNKGKKRRARKLRKEAGGGLISEMEPRQTNWIGDTGGWTITWGYKIDTTNKNSCKYMAHSRIAFSY